MNVEFNPDENNNNSPKQAKSECISVDDESSTDSTDYLGIRKLKEKIRKENLHL